MAGGGGTPTSPHQPGIVTHPISCLQTMSLPHTGISERHSSRRMSSDRETAASKRLLSHDEQLPPRSQKA